MAPAAHRPRRPGRLLTTAMAAAVVVAVPGPVGIAPARPADAAVAQRVPIAVERPDPALTTALDEVMAASPEDSCLVVSIDGTEMYDHRGDEPQIPASTQKLLTAGAVLDALGPDHRFETVLATDAEVIDGVVRGDVVLIGSGDPSLVSSPYRAFRGHGEDRPATLLDDLARALREAGIVRIEGSIRGDDRRHDDQRVVATWPERHAAENQAGPLSALGADEGFALVEGVDGLERVRSPLPAITTASTLTALVRLSGIEVRGDAGGVEPGAPEVPATRLAAVTSPPLIDLVADMVRRSDNRAAEVLLKELAVAGGGAGTTNAGAEAVAAWVQGLGVEASSTTVSDGSGLERSNQVTCQQLVDVLDAAGGPTGAVAEGLPVAGTSGTLRNRLRDPSVVGRVRAKTGALDRVTALAGFADLPDGGVATFAYVANGEWVTPEVLGVQDRLAGVLTSYEPPCPTAPPRPIASPAASDLAILAATEAGLGVTGLPGVVGVVSAISARPVAVVDRCSAAAGVSPVADLG